MDMLCYMWESPIRGVMAKPNKDIYSKDEIIRLVGTDSNGSTGWLDLLIDAGVCGVSDDGAIYSRRMVRDNELCQKRREAGKRGGDRTKLRLMQKVSEPQKETRQETAKDNQSDLFGYVTPDPKDLTPEQKAKAEKAKKYQYADDVTLTRDEYAKLCERYSEDEVKGMIDLLSNFKGQNCKRYRSDYKAILNWVVNAYYERKQKEQEYGKRKNECKATVSDSEQTSGFCTGTTL